MYSFYGGKQGRTYRITTHFDSIYDMVQAFNEGGSYTDVNYDEYVIIDTILRKNEKNNAENGIIYRRGYDFSQAFNPEEITLDDHHTLSPNQLTETAQTLYANEYNVEYEYGALTEGSISVQTRVPKYYNFSYKIATNDTVEIIINNDDFNTEAWNDDWEKFVTHPGGGAIYVGQIVGPEGDSPAVELIDWDEWRQYVTTEEGMAEQVRGSFQTDPKPGYDYSRRLTDGYDANGFHDKIQYGHCTLRDDQGNVTGAYLAFDIPYTVFNFEASSVSAYGEEEANYQAVYDEETQTWTYRNLIQENDDSLTHPFYKHFNISIPKGIHGRDIDNLSIDTYAEQGGDYLTYQYKDYNAEGEPAASQKILLSPYKVISNISAIRRSDSYIYNNTTSIYNYPHRLEIKYTYGESAFIDYNTIERVWVQVEDNGALLAEHVYIRLSNGNLIDAGLLKKVTHVAKDLEDDKYYTYYNDGTQTELPIAEIDKVAFNGDLFLIRFNNVNEAEVSQTYEYQGENWINLGTVVKGNHILTNFATIEDLEETYPYGLGTDETTENRAGWVVTVGPDANNAYSLYAFDYRTESWYSIQELGANNIKPDYSVLVSKATSNNINIPVENDLLNEHGIWFVVTE